MRPYPAFLNLHGKKAVVVGGGRVARRKVRSLLRAGAEVTVVSPDLVRDLDRLAGSGRIIVKRRAFRRTDVKNAFVVVAATDRPEVNGRVADAAPGLCNVADDPARSNFMVPSSFHRGRLTVAVSTGGLSPALARRVRQDLEASIGAETGRLLDELGKRRSDLRKKENDPLRRRRALLRMAASDPSEGTGKKRSRR